MKKITFLILLISSLINGQTEYSGFTVEGDNNMTFKHVFELKETQSKQDLMRYLKTLSSVKISDAESDISGSIEGLKINKKKYGDGKGYSGFMRYDLSSDFLIQFKNNRYRIILKDIGFMDNTTLYSMSTFKESDNYTSISNFYVKKDGTIRQSKIMLRGLELLQNQFIDMFTIKEVNDDW